jgi:divalent metal cation (Fe/Co/Zn/Cd) transporter
MRSSILVPSGRSTASKSNERWQRHRVVKHLEWFRWFAVATGILLFVAAVIFSHSVSVSSDALDRVMRYDWSTSGFQGRNEAASPGTARHAARLVGRPIEP